MTEPTQHADTVAGWTKVYTVDWTDEPGYGVPPLYASKADAEKKAAEWQVQVDADFGPGLITCFVREHDIIPPLIDGSESAS